MIKYVSTIQYNSYDSCADELQRLANKIKKNIISIIITPIKDKFIGSIFFDLGD